jgi:hypothetical protein
MLGNEQAPGGVEVAAHTVGVDVQTLGGFRGVAGGDADETEGFAKGLPFGVPGVGGALVLGGEGAVQNDGDAACGKQHGQAGLHGAAVVGDNADAGDVLVQDRLDQRVRHTTQAAAADRQRRSVTDL